MSIDGHSETQLIPKLLLQVSVQELHNSMVSSPEEGGIKEERYADNNIIIGDSTIRSILPPHLKKMSARYKVMCGCECCVFSRIIHSSLLSWSDCYLRKLNNLSQNKQNRRSSEKGNHIFDKYKTL